MQMPSPGLLYPLTQDQRFLPLGPSSPSLRLRTNKKNLSLASLSMASVFQTLSRPQHSHATEKETEARGHGAARWGSGRARKHLQAPTAAYLSLIITRPSAKLPPRDHGAGPASRHLGQGLFQEL